MVIEKKIFIGVTEVAEILGVHKNTLHRWLKKDWEKNNNKKEIDKTSKNKQQINFLLPPYKRIGIRYKFLKEDVEKFIKDSIKD